MLTIVAALTVAISCKPEPKIEEPLMLSFTFKATDNVGILTEDCVGTINGTSIAIAVPPQAMGESLIASFTTNEGNVVKIGTTIQTSGVTSNVVGTSMSYTVSSEDGAKTANYTVSVAMGPDPNPTIESLAFLYENNSDYISKDIVAVIDGTDITVSVPQTADVSKLVATFVTTANNVVTVEGEVQTSNSTANDFTTPVDYIVTNSDGSVNKMFSVTVNKTKGAWSQIATMDLYTVYSGPVLKVNPNDDLPYIAFREREVSSIESASANKGHLVKFDGTSWSSVGAAGFSPEINGSTIDLAFLEDGTPYVSFQNAEEGNKPISVMKYIGSAVGAWTMIGNAETSDMQSTYPHIALLADDNIIVSQVNNSSKSSLPRRHLVMSYWDGSSWTNREPEQTASITTYQNDLCVANGVVYLTSINREVVNGVKYGHNVLKYENGVWTSLRSHYVAEGAEQTGTSVLDIAADDNGNVYLATSDNASGSGGYQIRVEKYDAASESWSTVGGNPLDYIIESHNYARIAVAPDGTVFAAYQNYDTKTIEVVYFDFNSSTKQWSSIEKLGEGRVKGEISIDFDSKGVGYLSYVGENNVIEVFKFE